MQHNSLRHAVFHSSIQNSVHLFFSFIRNSYHLVNSSIQQLYSFLLFIYPTFNPFILFISPKFLFIYFIHLSKNSVHTFLFTSQKFYSSTVFYSNIQKFYPSYFIHLSKNSIDAFYLSLRNSIHQFYSTIRILSVLTVLH